LGYFLDNRDYHNLQYLVANLSYTFAGEKKNSLWFRNFHWQQKQSAGSFHGENFCPARS